MIRPICRDTVLLSRPAAPATAEDREVMRDLADTLAAHQNECVGMAANMIGVPKRIIALAVGPMRLLMVNPVISERKQPFRAEEGCLSLSGTRPVTRYRTVTVCYEDDRLQPRRMTYTGWTAQIIQHECDHLEGILI